MHNQDDERISLVLTLLEPLVSNKENIGRKRELEYEHELEEEMEEEEKKLLLEDSTLFKIFWHEKYFITGVK